MADYYNLLFLVPRRRRRRWRRRRRRQQQPFWAGTTGYKSVHAETDHVALI